ncbi:alkaline phosphatase family protein [Lapillicoccus sp.]|uniref:alkaline phosphatase family protein n=1 Tax=Lapillicoccus sp. TaxID=1909287 RepID=UPI0039834101
MLRLSVDGLQQDGLDWVVRAQPRFALARLVAGGTSYIRAQTPVPSVSFPGLLVQVTGGNPTSTGVYYDVSDNRALLPAGTTSCTGGGGFRD